MGPGQADRSKAKRLQLRSWRKREGMLAAELLLVAHSRSMAMLNFERDLRLQCSRRPSGESVVNLRGARSDQVARRHGSLE